MRAAPISLSPPLAESLSAAAEVIAAVIGGRNLDRALADVAPRLRPAVQDIAYGTLRQYARGDALLAPLLTKPLGDTKVHALLLAAVYRLEARPDDAHTTVDQAVTAAATVANGRFKSLVNAVLRNFQRCSGELIDTALRSEPARWQHPQWWIDKLRGAYPHAWQQILTAGNTRPPMTLRLNRRRVTDPAAYIARLAQNNIDAHLLDRDAIMLSRPLPVAQLPGFAEGDVSVQDVGAQRAAHLLDLHDGMRVLDACAAPGGKTAHMLEVADIDLLALDVDARRLERVAENLRRLRIKAHLQAADCAQLDAWWNPRQMRPFDRVLADVPCSASGVVRRHPDAKWLRRKSDVAKFAQTQARILDALWQVLGPGGKMLYCTCSVFEEENRRQMDAFVSRHADAVRVSTGNTDHPDHLQLLPCDEHDGFYYALLMKHA